MNFVIAVEEYGNTYKICNNDATKSIIIPYAKFKEAEAGFHGFNKDTIATYSDGVLNKNSCTLIGKKIGIFGQETKYVICDASLTRKEISEDKLIQLYKSGMNFSNMSINADQEIRMLGCKMPIIGMTRDFGGSLDAIYDNYRYIIVDKFTRQNIPGNTSKKFALDIVYKIRQIDKNGRLIINEDGIKEITIDELAKQVRTGSIQIANYDFIADDLKIFKSRNYESCADSINAFKTMCVKRELLGLPCSKIHRVLNDYIMKTGVPDENGVLTIPDFVTELSINFGDSLRDKKIRKVIWKNPRCYELSYFFAYNDNIVDVDLTEFNISVIPDISDLFYNCKKLRSVDFGNNAFSNNYSISDLFDNCNALETVKMSKATFKRCRENTGMFRFCSELKELNIGKADLTKCKCRETLYCCANVRSIRIDKIDIMELIHFIRNIHTSVDNYGNVHTIHINVNTLTGVKRRDTNTKFKLGNYLDKPKAFALSDMRAIEQNYSSNDELNQSIESLHDEIRFEALNKVMNLANRVNKPSGCHRLVCATLGHDFIFVMDFINIIN